MGKVPIDNTGCYVKYTFPNDFVLPDSALRAYQGADMMATGNNPVGVVYSTLNVGSEVFIGNQASANPDGTARAADKRNQIIVKGCTTTTGADQKAKVKFTGIYTPAAAKKTNSFTVEVYHSYSQAKQVLSGPILTAEGTIPADRFTAGTMTVGSFIAPSTLVQTATVHTIAFTLTNALPSKTSNALYNSRILILMPAEMYLADPAGLSVTSMDNTLQSTTVKRDTTYTTG